MLGLLKKILCLREAGRGQEQSLWVTVNNFQAGNACANDVGMGHLTEFVCGRVIEALDERMLVCFADTATVVSVTDVRGCQQDPYTGYSSF